VLGQEQERDLDVGALPVRAEDHETDDDSVLVAGDAEPAGRVDVLRLPPARNRTTEETADPAVRPQGTDGGHVVDHHRPQLQPLGADRPIQPD
jgi:hypothetical protein